MSNELNNIKVFNKTRRALLAYAQASALEDTNTREVIADVEAFDKILRRIVSDAEAR